MKLNKHQQIEELTNQILILKTHPPNILTKNTIQKLQQRIDNLINT